MSHEEECLRQTEANNPATPADLLVRLAQDQDEAVRRAVASNPNTPLEAKQRLSQDGNRYVRAMARAAMQDTAREA